MAEPGRAGGYSGADWVEGVTLRWQLTVTLILRCGEAASKGEGVPGCFNATPAWFEAPLCGAPHHEGYWGDREGY